MNEILETKVFLFVRKIGVDGTSIIEVDIKEAMKFIKENRKNKDKFQIGILAGNSYDNILDVYGEYAPVKKIDSLEELNLILL